MNSISRRRMISQGMLGGAMVGAGLRVAAASTAEATATPARRKLRVMVTGGHPGDPEYGCGGTIARYADRGDEVLLLYLNKGDPAETASRPASEVRVSEAGEACRVLGARPVFAGQIDGHAVVDPEHYERFRKLLQEQSPDAVFTHWPIDNHADHRAMFNLVYDAWIRLGRKFALYFYEVSTGEDTVQFSPTDYVDITATAARKRKACYAHASQSPDRYYALQESVTRMRGLESGSNQAEAFVRHVQSPPFPLPPEAR
ncbi:MAG: PIG-L deacetylase family protein [Verrucomicrobiota bacterium]